jgi:AraC family ethanolamine operon transcriptional activator
LQLGPSDAQRLESFLNIPWELRSEWESGSFDDRLISSYEEDLMQRVCTTLSRAWMEAPPPSLLRKDRYDLFARAAQLMRDPSAHPEHLTDICGTLEVGEETLRRAFQEFLGLPPMQYRRLQRMHRCRDQLIACDPQKENVKTVAYGNGFYSMGRFAVEYKRIFGESPSQTLRQSARSSVQ